MPVEGPCNRSSATDVTIVGVFCTISQYHSDYTTQINLYYVYAEFRQMRSGLKFKTGSML
jgi:hypothetical protein